MTSILDSVKKVCNIDLNDEAFDDELILHINSVFLALNQLGVGPKVPYSITDASDSWTDFFGDNPEIEMVKTYVGLKVRTVFDPPTIGAVSEAIKSAVAEMEWRLNVQVDPGSEVIPPNG